MKDLYDHQFKRLNDAISFDEETEKRIQQKLLHARNKSSSLLLPKLMTAIMPLLVLATLFYFFIDGNEKTILDTETNATLSQVEQTEDSFLLEWGSDGMDRGNHDLESHEHGKLVVSSEFHSIKRGDILYYEMNNQERIGRVIGLPGETVSIQDGQVYINDKKLETFYGVATVRGYTREQYFKVTPPEVITNPESSKEYFQTSMDAVNVEEGTVFLLVDQWWRGIDSRDLGLISFESIKGKILGYEK